ncbi:unnamed protein product, partial [Oppiella nova]
MTSKKTSSSETKKNVNKKSLKGNNSTLKAGLVFGLGNPLLDISATVKPEFLETYGLLPNDQILADERHHDMFTELLKDYKVDYSAGGDIQNSLRVMQWYFVDTPFIAVYMGCVGNDSNGIKMETKARRDGVNAVYMVDNEENTGACVCLLTKKGKNRSLCAFLGASLKFNVQHIRDNYKYVENAQYFLASGYHLAVSVESVLCLAEHCHKNNKVFLFALSATYICTKYSKELLQIYPYVDYMFANETEGREFSEMMSWPTSELKD